MYLRCHDGTELWAGQRPGGAREWEAANQGETALAQSTSAVGLGYRWGGVLCARYLVAAYGVPGAPANHAALPAALMIGSWRWLFSALLLLCSFRSRLGLGFLLGSP